MIVQNGNSAQLTPEYQIKSRVLAAGKAMHEKNANYL